MRRDIKFIYCGFLTFFGALFSCDKADIPTVTTTEITNITANSVITGGKITYGGSGNVHTRGVCWSTNPTPSISDNITADGAGGGSFISSISRIKDTTTYYVRAYATNKYGTGYGDIMSFKTLQGVRDIEGNVYNTILIGTQLWMMENLKTTIYNDGIWIPEVTDYNWCQLETPAYCWFHEGVAFYNWFTVNTGKLCPTGWHIPGDDEWTALIDHLGGYDVAGGKMKESGTIHWRSPNVGATNESGFAALPSGFFNCSYGGFEAIYNTCYWWSSTKYLTDYVWIIKLSNDRIDVVRDFKSKKNGYPVRCVKD